MILDRLENAALYRNLHPRLAAALDYLTRTDFSQAPNGKQELDGKALFAIVQRYPGRPMEEMAWEAHRRYADVQFIFSGKEKMGYVNRHEGLTSGNLTIKTPYNAESDVEFYQGPGDFFNVDAGAFAIFFPEDVHAPCLAAGPQRDEICKVVVKCQVD